MRVFKEGRGERSFMSRWFGVGGQGWKPKDIILSDDTADLQWTNLVKGGNAKNLGELRGVIKLGANCTVTEVTETVLPEDVSDFLQTKDMKFYVIKLMREGEKDFVVGYVDKPMIDNLREQIMYNIEKSTSAKK